MRRVRTSFCETLRRSEVDQEKRTPYGEHRQRTKFYRCLEFNRYSRRVGWVAAPGNEAKLPRMRKNLNSLAWSCRRCLQLDRRRTIYSQRRGASSTHYRLRVLHRQCPYEFVSFAGTPRSLRCDGDQLNTMVDLVQNPDAQACRFHLDRCRSG